MIHILRELSDLYAALPSVDCSGCGRCCVSPTCTLVECIYLLQGVMNDGGKGIVTAIERPLMEHAVFEGNMPCMFQVHNRCDVHFSRTSACRLFGIPAVEMVEIPEMVRCFHPGKNHQSDFSGEMVHTWLRDLIELNRRIYPVGEEPYFLIGLPLEAWVDLWLHEPWQQSYFRNIHTLLRENCPVPMGLEDKPYRQRTGIQEKIRLIDDFYAIIDGGDVREMHRILTSIRDDFPFTGTWYLDEANRYLSEIEDSCPRRNWASPV